MGVNSEKEMMNEKQRPLSRPQSQRTNPGTTLPLSRTVKSAGCPDRSRDARVRRAGCSACNSSGACCSCSCTAGSLLLQLEASVCTELLPDSGAARRSGLAAHSITRHAAGGLTPMSEYLGRILCYGAADVEEKLGVFGCGEYVGQKVIVGHACCDRCVSSGCRCFGCVARRS